jgi:ankyrin repeat protein
MMREKFQKIKHNIPILYMASIKSNAEKSPLSLAVSNGDVEKVRVLLQNGTDVNELDHNGDTSIMVASYNGNVELAQLLVEEGADITKENDETNALLLAIFKGNLEIVKILIEAGADTELPIRDDHTTPLLMAAGTDHLEIVESLLKAGAHINKDDVHGQTPLFIACVKNNLKMVQLLLNAGADIDNSDNNHNTPLLISALNRNLELVNYLLENGATVDNSILQKVVEAGYVKIVSALLEHADINQTSPQGQGLLYSAVRKDRLEVAELLLEKGAEISHNTQNDPLNLAIENANLEMVELLIPYFPDFKKLKKKLEKAWFYCNGLEGEFEADCDDDDSGNRKAILEILQDRVLHMKPEPDVQSIPLPEATGVIAVVNHEGETSKSNTNIVPFLQNHRAVTQINGGYKGKKKPKRKTKKRRKKKKKSKRKTKRKLKRKRKRRTKRKM